MPGLRVVRARRGGAWLYLATWGEVVGFAGPDNDHASAQTVKVTEGGVTIILAAVDVEALSPPAVYELLSMRGGPPRFYA